MDTLSKRIGADLLKDFKTPFPSFKMFREAVGLDFDEGAELFWIYWTPAGDEMIVGRVLPGIGFGEFDGEWGVWLRLRMMNPNVFDAPGRGTILGCSEEQGTHVLLVEKDDPFKVYLASKNKLYSVIFRR